MGAELSTLPYRVTLVFDGDKYLALRPWRSGVGSVRETTTSSTLPPDATPIYEKVQPTSLPGTVASSVIASASILVSPLFGSAEESVSRAASTTTTLLSNPRRDFLWKIQAVPPEPGEPGTEFLIRADRHPQPSVRVGVGPSDQIVADEDPWGPR